MSSVEAKVQDDIIQTFPLHGGDEEVDMGDDIIVGGLYFEPSTFVSFSDDREIRFWDLRCEKLLKVVGENIFINHYLKWRDCSVGIYDYFLVCCDEGKIIKFSASRMERVNLFHQESNERGSNTSRKIVRMMRISDKELMFVCYGDSHIKILKNVGNSLKQTIKLRKISSHYQTKLVRSKTKKNITFINTNSKNGYNIIVYDFECDEIIKEFEEPKNFVNTMENFIDHNNEEILLAIGDEEVIFFFNVDKGVYLRSIRAKQQIFTTTFFSSDGVNSLLFCGSIWGGLYVYDITKIANFVNVLPPNSEGDEFLLYENQIEYDYRRISTLTILDYSFLGDNDLKNQVCLIVMSGSSHFHVVKLEGLLRRDRKMEEKEDLEERKMYLFRQYTKVMMESCEKCSEFLIGIKSNSFSDILLLFKTFLCT